MRVTKIENLASAENVDQGEVITGVLLDNICHRKLYIIYEIADLAVLFWVISQNCSEITDF